MAALQTEWAQLLPQWISAGRPFLERPGNLKRVRALCASGIPSYLRGRVWPLAVGNALNITPALYEVFAAHGRSARVAADRAKSARSAAARARVAAAAEAAAALEALGSDGGSRHAAAGGAGGPAGAAGSGKGQGRGVPAGAAAALSSVEAGGGGATMYGRSTSGSVVVESDYLLSGPGGGGGGGLMTSSVDAAAGDMRGGGGSSMGGHGASSFSANADGALSGSPRSASGGLGSPPASASSSLVSSPSVLRRASLLGKEASASYIEVDLARTFPRIANFATDGDLHDSLREVLEAYCFFRPDCGYVQGMSYLAGMLLLYMDSFHAFQCLANLLSAHSSALLSLYKMEPQLMKARFDSFQEVLAKTLPSVAHRFAELDITPDTYLFSWWVTGFSKVLPLDIACRIWDQYLIEDENLPARVALAILHTSAPRLVRCALWLR